MDLPFKMISRIFLLYTLLGVCICGVNSVDQFKTSGVIDENTSWLETALTRYPALRYEVHMSFTFQQDICCPIVHFFSDLQHHYEHLLDFYLGSNNCLLNVSTEGTVYWFKSTTFVLPNNTQSDGKCQSSNGYYKCNISTIILNYEPKVRWLTLGYPCNAQKNLSGLQYEIRGNVQNTTQCELMQIPKNANSFYFQCNHFYNYVTFPNVFGHRSETEAFAFIQVFQAIIENMDRSCHKHLDYTLCQSFLPQCPDGANKTASHLTVICKEMCLETVEACLKSMSSVFNFIDCNYYAKTLDLPCIHKPVTCKSPPLISNGQIRKASIENNNKSYPVGSTVRYSCNKDFELKGNNTAMCQYSGIWTPSIYCKSNLHIKMLTIGISGGVSLLLITIVCIYAAVRHKKNKRHAKYFENQPLQKRNKEKDAFISFVGDEGPDYDFVKNVLQPKLEKQEDPPFKVTIHLRDFRADTLIYVNIRNAVTNSNSAIILMSQAYIDARWCREEFEVSFCQCNLGEGSIIFPTSAMNNDAQ